MCCGKNTILSTVKDEEEVENREGNACIGSHTR